MTMGRSSSCSSAASLKHYRDGVNSEGILREIFRRLPVKPMYKFRCVSKLWNSLLCDTIFKYFRTTPPWTLVYHEHDTNGRTLFETRFPQLHHKFMTGSEGSFDFLLDSDIFRNNKNMRLHLLASCMNGLVLFSNRGQDSNPHRFFICNPLTQQCVSLPSRPHQGDSPRSVGTARLVSEVVDSTCNYKVVYIPTEHPSMSPFKLQIFSSDTGRWNVCKIPWNTAITKYCHAMFVRNGVLYWTDKVKETNRMIVMAYNLERDRCQLIDLPQDSINNVKYCPHCFDGFFGESEGSIYYGHVDYGHINETQDMPTLLSVWLLLEDCVGGWSWQLIHNSIELKITSTFRSLEGVSKRFNPVDRNVVIFVRGRLCLTYNIETGTSEVLQGSPTPSIIRNTTNPPLLVTPKPTIIPLLPSDIEDVTRY